MAWDAGVRVEVTGRKADSVPVLRRPDDEAEGSRGLRLVEELAARWGYERGGGWATTWFELQALLQPMQQTAVSAKASYSGLADIYRANLPCPRAGLACTRRGLAFAWSSRPC